MTTLILRVAGDLYLTGPQFTVTVDGQMVTGVFTTSASHSAGQYDDVEVLGNFPAVPSSVAINFINDAYGGWGLDRNLYVKSLSLGGMTVAGDQGTNTAGPNQNGEADLWSAGSLTFNTASLFPVTTTPPLITLTQSSATAVPDTLVIRVSEDAYNGNAQFIVSVDGVQVGGVQTATASHAAGQHQDITLSGDFGPSPKEVDVTFLNDAYGGFGLDRNLYVSEISLNGRSVSGGAATGVAVSHDEADMFSNSTAAFQISRAPALVTTPLTTTQSSTAASLASPATDTLIVRVSEDAYLVDAQFKVTVDGVQIGGVLNATASHAKGRSQDIELTGNFGKGPKEVDISFLNDAYGGFGLDRNLYIQSLTINGITLPGSAATGVAVSGTEASLLGNSTAAFLIPASTTAAPVTTAPTIPVTTTSTTPTNATSGTLVVRVSEDAYQGDAQFKVAVDGVQIGGVLTATAPHGAGQYQDVTLTGNFGASPQEVDVTFLNDAYGGWGLDRNLYVHSISIDGISVSGSASSGVGIDPTGSAMLLANSTAAFHVPAAVTTVMAQPVPLTVTATTTKPTSSTNAVPVSNTLQIRVAEDAYNGDAQFIVSVDGHQLGGILTATASHSAGKFQDIEITGLTGTPSTVAVTYINDANGGWNLDRNLYVESITLNGHVVLGSQASNSGGPSLNFEADLYSNGTATFDVSHLPSTAVTSMGSGSLSLLGVNLPGAEFGGARPGVYGTDYIYPSHSEIDYYASKGLNIIRLPFLWERLQNSEHAPLNSVELARIDDVVDYAAQRGLKVILDTHNYGTYYNSAIGTAATPDSAFADFWGKVAAHFASDRNVLFGLMNEPNQQTATSWLASVNTAISAIREAGATQEILVPGTHWDSAFTWTNTDNASVFGTGVLDPLHNFAFEVHQYLDSNGSGNSAGVDSTSIGVERLAAITSWAEATGVKLFLGEFGVTPDAASLTALDNMLSFMGAHSNVWQGGTYWAGETPWGTSNIYGIAPTVVGTSVVDPPQLTILTHYVTHTG